MRLARADGFTLIELMIVAALVAVMAGIAIPAIAGAMSQYTVISASQQVVSTIRSARVQAVGKNQILKVNFDPAAGTLQVQDAADQPIGPPTALPVGALFVAADTDVQFDTSGRLVAAIAAPVTVVVGNGDAARNRTITITRSGRVQLP
jgi:prepilin-type N-terminal cleavage/methylation domain-containing protein